MTNITLFYFCSYPVIYNSLHQPSLIDNLGNMYLFLLEIYQSLCSYPNFLLVTLYLILLRKLDNLFYMKIEVRVANLHYTL